jgi:hypothetical protein
LEEAGLPIGVVCLIGRSRDVVWRCVGASRPRVCRRDVCDLTHVLSSSDVSFSPSILPSHLFEADANEFAFPSSSFASPINTNQATPFGGNAPNNGNNGYANSPASAHPSGGGVNPFTGSGGGGPNVSFFYCFTSSYTTSSSRSYYTTLLPILLLLHSPSRATARNSSLTLISLRALPQAPPAPTRPKARRARATRRTRPRPSARMRSGGLPTLFLAYLRFRARVSTFEASRAR